MRIEDILNKSNFESFDIDFKTTLNREKTLSWVKSLIAFANCGDGTSEPKNTETMRFFRLLHFSQRTGYGVSNIYAIMRSYGYPTPTLNVHSSPDYTELRIFLFGRDIQIGSAKLSAQDVLSAIASADGISQKELTTLFGVSRNTMTSILNALLASGQIRTNGIKQIVNSSIFRE